MPEIILYQFTDCPFCAKVRAALGELGLAYEKVDVSRDWNDSFRKELEKKSKIRSIPLLKVDDKFIGESVNIVWYLEKNFENKN